jgi:hypothetical protein
VMGFDLDAVDLRPECQHALERMMWYGCAVCEAGGAECDGDGDDDDEHDHD